MNAYECTITACSRKMIIDHRAFFSGTDQQQLAINFRFIHEKCSTRHVLTLGRQTLTKGGRTSDVITTMAGLVLFAEEGEHDVQFARS